MIHQGLTLDEISSELGITYGQAWSIKDDLGLAATKKGQDVTFQIISRLMNTEETFEAIGSTVNRSRQRVEQVAAKMREFGIPLNVSRRRKRLPEN